jgi:DNA-binding response OmpR family regulator
VIRALLVDDDRDLARLLTEYFVPHDVAIVHVGDGDQAIAALGASTFDVVLLDVMLPGIDGFEVCRRMRASSAIPIVMLTARGDDNDRITGLETGADDYVPKPFNPRELLARIRAVLRRSRATPAGRIVVGSIAIDPSAMTVTKDGSAIALTSFELRVLYELAKRVGETVTREELAGAVHDPKVKGEYDPSVDRSLDVHVSRLRQKLEDDPKEPRYIKTVRGVGYILARPS